MARVDTSACCNGGKGKGPHLNGCALAAGAPSAREAARKGNQAADLNEQKKRVGADMRAKAEKYVRRHSGTLFTTYAPAGTNGMPPGVHMEAVEHKGEKHYRIVLD